jgi:hypothetical protein
MLAGIIPSKDSPDMVLVSEPEAAALTACSQASLTVDVGEVLLIVDAGSETVDFTMHVVENHLGNKVLSEATYRACLLQVSGLQGAAPAVLVSAKDRAKLPRRAGLVAPGCTAVADAAPTTPPPHPTPHPPPTPAGLQEAGRQL